MNAWLSTGLLPDDAEWVPVTTGESGDTVLRDHDGACYAKLVTPERSADLAAERDRIVWLGDAGIPDGAVLDWRSTDRGACLVTRAVAGVPADQLGADALRETWLSIINLARELHDIDATSCPFGRSLATMMALARTTVAENRVQVNSCHLNCMRPRRRKYCDTSKTSCRAHTTGAQRVSRLPR